MIPVSLGLDFGTESVRALFINAQGKELGTGVVKYEHGQITEFLPNSDVKLPPHFALQHSHDWIIACKEAVKIAMESGGIDPQSVVGIGVDFTSCTMLPTNKEGKDLFSFPRDNNNPYAYPKLWKHHGAITQTARMNQIAVERNEKFLDRYGGIIGLEWLLPKILETIENAPEVAEEAEVWLEAGDWFVWQLTSCYGEGSFCKIEDLVRSTCQAGYKGLWSAEDGYPSQEYLHAVHPKLAEAVATKMPGRYLAPGVKAGKLSKLGENAFGLPAGIAVSAATIDAHAAVPGVGAAEPGTLVMVMGTSSCHMLNSLVGKAVPGVAGIVYDGILPGMYGYETGQAAVGDAFAWLLKLFNLTSFDEISKEAMALNPGADGLICLDWMNGCRTPLMDGELKGAFHGLTLHHKPAHFYRALLEASGYGLRWIVDLFRSQDIPINKFIATGGLPHHNLEVVQIYANILQEEIEIHPAKYASAVGAAVLGMFAAGPEKSGFNTIQEAITSMATVEPAAKKVVRPDKSLAATYQTLYEQYRQLADLAVKFQDYKNMKE